MKLLLKIACLISGHHYLKYFKYEDGPEGHTGEIGIQCWRCKKPEPVEQ